MHKPQEHTISRFISGLHKEIANSVELQAFATLEDVIILAVKIERQRKRNTPRVGKPYTASSFSYVTKLDSTPGEKKESTVVVVVNNGKKKFEVSQPSTITCDIKCF